MNFSWDIGVLLGFGLVLSAAAGIVLRSSMSLATRLGLTGYAVGFLFLGVLTSLPEFFVAVGAVTGGIPQLSAGNLIGGSLLLLSLVMGLSSILAGGISIDHGLSLNEIAFNSAVIALPAFVLWDGTLTRGDGLVLVTAYVIHAMVVRRDGKGNRKKRTHLFRNFYSDAVMLLVGLGGLALSSRIIVGVGHGLAQRLGLPDFVFGLILLSFGTNLPEFALALEGILLRRQSIVFGDFLGSSATNTFIMGLLGLFSPFRMQQDARLFVSLALLVGVSVFFVWASRSKKYISRAEGFGLLAFFVVFVLFEIFAFGA